MQSLAVNEMVKSIKKHEVRHTGVALQAQRPFTYKEMILLLDLALVVLPDSSKRLRFLAMLCLQWQLIGRVDNTQKVQVHNFSFSNDQPQTIRCRLTWSKNISEERKAPQQMLIGSMESKICVLQALASYLEQQFEATASTRELFIFWNRERWQLICTCGAYQDLCP